MSQKPRRIPVTGTGATARPGQDMVTVQQQAGQFPSVGMTLPSYQYDPRDHHRRRTGQAVIVKKGRWQRWRRNLTLKRIAVTLAIVLLVAGVWVGGKFAYNAHKLFGGNILGVLRTTKLKGEDKGRVNILLAGNSADDPGHSGASLTDSIMVLSIDTKNNKAFMLSIPRDLWVDIPNDGHSKINSVYVAGQSEEYRADGYPDGGMGLLEETIEQDLGLPINYYALIDYNAFKQAVDAVGGIDINVQSGDKRGLYDPNIDYATGGPLVKLTNGNHHLNGAQALNLARARGDSYYSYGFPASDFDRTQHQRQMLVALKSKAVSAGVIANPAKLSSLSDAVGNNVKTDLKISEVHRLYDLTKLINANDIQSLSLNSANGKNLLASYSSPNGESALIPAAGLDDFEDIQAYIKRQSSSNLIIQEGAKLVLLNATSTNGLASKQKTKLLARDLIVSDVGDAKAPQKTTVIIDNSKGKKPATLKLLTQLYGTNVTKANPYSNMYQGDFIVLLGSDQLKTASTSNSNSH